MTFLIDGYNLMHAVGLAAGAMPGRRFEQARTRFLNWLADQLGDRPDPVRVVFDTTRAAGKATEQDHRGVRVRFAVGQTADDLIEELIAAEPHPDRLAVVSNDTRLQDAARRRGCGVFPCERFVDWLIEPPKPGVHNSDSPEEKPAPNPTAEETAAWLRAFSDPPKKRRR